MKQSMELRVPAMKVAGLVITQAGDDVLVYDQHAQTLHTLNAVINEIWQLCDGTQTVNSIVTGTGHSAEVVKQALSQLEDASLLESGLDDSQRASESRRSFMKKAGIVAIPAVISVSVPLAKAAATGDGFIPTDCGEACDPDDPDLGACEAACLFYKVCGSENPVNNTVACVHTSGTNYVCQIGCPTTSP